MYLGIVAWFIFCGLICNDNRKKVASDKSFYYMFFPLLVLVMGLRSASVGVDTRSYIMAFELASNHSIKEIINGDLHLAVEPLYLIFMKVISWIANDYYVFQVIYAIIYCSGMGFFIKNNTDKPLFATALFLGLDLYLNAFNLQRQMLAVMLSLLAWESMKKQKLKRTILFFVIAFCFHRTAIVFVLASLIYFCRKNKTVLRIITLAIIAMSIRFNTILEWLSLNVSEYKNYYGNHKMIQTAGGVWIIWIIVIIMSVITIMMKEKDAFDNNDNNKSVVKDDKVIAIFSLLYIIPNIIGLYFNSAQRIGLYFLPFVILLFINFERVLNESYRLKYRYGVMICFLAYFILTSQSSQYDYHFCF